MMTRRHVLLTIATMAALGLATSVVAQDDKPQIKVGVLPFVDATGTGGVEAGPALSRLVQAEIRPLDRTPRPCPVARQRPAGRCGRGKGRSARQRRACRHRPPWHRARSDERGIQQERMDTEYRRPECWRKRAPSEGQGHPAGRLIDTSSGKRLASLRVKGEESDTHVGASVYTGLGSIGTDSNGWLNSPIGKAMSKAVAELVKRVNVEAAKVKPAS